jgi:hypothetical protein
MTLNETTNDNSRTTDRPVRLGTVVWGFLLIGLAALFFAIARFDFSAFQPGVVAAWAVLGIGALALVGGVLGAILRSRA